MSEFPAWDEFRQKPEAEQKALLVIGDPQAEAYAWICGYAQNLSSMVGEDDDYGYGSDSVTVDELIETGISHITPGSWGDYISRGGAFESMNTDPTFWDKLSILLGVPIPISQRGGILSCSC